MSVYEKKKKLFLNTGMLCGDTCFARYPHSYKNVVE